ncbi:MAG TPA: hypothetical protein PLW94_03180 [Candidatus Absconditabacterales bacterium]|nr:hypothetical protein [Candidatus Absconditabacterales bacterium]
MKIEIENLISALILGMLFFITIIITLFVENGVVEKRKYIYTTPVYIPCKNADQLRRYEEIRDMAKRLAETVETNCPESLDKFLAITNIEQAVIHQIIA